MSKNLFFIKEGFVFCRGFSFISLGNSDVQAELRNLFYQKSRLTAIVVGGDSELFPCWQPWVGKEEQMEEVAFFPGMERQVAAAQQSWGTL